MKTIIPVGLFILLIISFGSCLGQSNSKQSSNETIKTNVIVGGGCDGCELMFIGMPETINATGYSPAWGDEGQALIIKGVIYKLDGTTPAPNVLLYYWQTNHEGYYLDIEALPKAAKRHGYIRGWVRSDKDGDYTIHTIKPAPYPNQKLPAHIHLSIKEPNIKDEYYIDELVFDDDPLLTEQERQQTPNRGGSGILKTVISDNVQIAKRDIILGLNIPDYPDGSSTSSPASN